MPTAQELISLIEPRKADLRAALPPERYKAFEESYYALTDALTGGADAGKTAQDLLALVQETYPEAGELLGLQKPAPPEKKEGTPPQQTAPAQPPPPPAVTSQGDVTMTTTPQPQPRKGMSVDAFITIFKEAVTAIIALLLVWTTVRMAASLLAFVGDATRMSQAKDLLGVLTGLMGVVLGYYFGRIPAEARAAQAQEQASQAISQSEQAKAQTEALGAQAEKLASQASELAAGMQGAPQARGGQAPVNEALKRWADEVQELGRMARRR